MNDSTTYPATVALIDPLNKNAILESLNVTDRKTAVATAKLMLAEYMNDDDRVVWTHSNPSLRGMLPNVAYLIDDIGEPACDFVVVIRPLNP